MRKGKLFVVSGPSGAGKGTICRRLIEDAEEGSLRLSISMTTRAPREGEQHGVSYFFATREEFLQRIEEDGFLEYAEVYENFYGTPKAFVEQERAAGRDVLLEIDIQGAMKVKKACPDGVFLFVVPPSFAILKERLIGRGTDSEETIRLRLSKARKELDFADEYDYLIINDDLETAVRTAESCIAAERARVTADSLAELAENYGEEQ